uniref:Uncharacterized protein n=1 Tax=Candidatus Kentrum sp. DK TaxID=2126562 RepID=A0A450T1E7_9GAMM|nr:MAG: hypothetical protein BECKDK2373B_GA0170837_109119 [Candidatus Kentron sp. DK]
MNDYEIDEIRRIRRRISEAHDHVPSKSAEHYRAMETELRKSERYRFADVRTHDSRLVDMREASETQP